MFNLEEILQDDVNLPSIVRLSNILNSTLDNINKRLSEYRLTVDSNSEYSFQSSRDEIINEIKENKFFGENIKRFLIKYTEYLDLQLRKRAVCFEIIKLHLNKSPENNLNGNDVFKGVTGSDSKGNVVLDTDTKNIAELVFDNQEDYNLFAESTNSAGMFLQSKRISEGINLEQYSNLFLNILPKSEIGYFPVIIARIYENQKIQGIIDHERGHAEYDAITSTIKLINKSDENSKYLLGGKQPTADQIVIIQDLVANILGQITTDPIAFLEEQLSKNTDKILHEGVYYDISFLLNQLKKLVTLYIDNFQKITSTNELLSLSANYSEYVNFRPADVVNRGIYFEIALEDEDFDKIVPASSLDQDLYYPGKTGNVAIGFNEINANLLIKRKQPRKLNNGNNPIDFYTERYKKLASNPLGNKVFSNLDEYTVSFFSEDSIDEPLLKWRFKSVLERKDKILTDDFIKAANEFVSILMERGKNELLAEFTAGYVVEDHAQYVINIGNKDDWEATYNYLKKSEIWKKLTDEQQEYIIKLLDDIYKKEIEKGAKIVDFIYQVIIFTINDSEDSNSMLNQNIKLLFMLLSVIPLDQWEIVIMKLYNIPTSVNYNEILSSFTKLREIRNSSNNYVALKQEVIEVCQQNPISMWDEELKKLVASQSKNI